MTIRWHGYLGGDPGDDVRGTIAFTLPEGRQPNWFHRQMQYLILGIYWHRGPRSVQHKEEQDERRRRDDKSDHYHRNFGIGHDGAPR